MKVLLAITMAIFFGNSAFAADECSVNNPNACDEAGCEKLPTTQPGKKWKSYTVNGVRKCMSGDGEVSSICQGVNGTILPKAPEQKGNVPPTNSTDSPR